MWPVLPSSLDQIVLPRVILYHTGVGTGVLEEPSAGAATEGRPQEGQRRGRQDDDIAHCVPRRFRHIQLEEVALFTRTYLPHSK